MRNSAKIRLIDIAQEANASVGAVGKVLNGGSAPIRVGEVTRKRIQEVAARLGYRQNVAASILAGGKSNLIGVVIDAQTGYRNKRLLVALETAASKRGLRLLTGVAHDSVANLEQICHRLLQYGVDGLLMISHDYPEFRNEVEEFEKTIPEAVYLEKPYCGSSKYVETSRVNALKEMVADVVCRGEKRIALIHGKLDSISEKTLLAEYKSALAANGVTFDPALVKGDFCLADEGIERIRKVAFELMEKSYPDVLFADNAEYAVAIQSFLQSKGFHFPEDLEIIGGNGDPFFNYVTPRIHSFDPRYEMIAETLLDKLPEKAAASTPRVIEAIYQKSSEKTPVRENLYGLQNIKN